MKEVSLLRYIPVIVITIGLVVSVAAVRNFSIKKSEARVDDYKAYGEGTTADVDFNFSIRQSGDEGDVKGSTVVVKSLSSEDEIRMMTVDVESVFWTSKVAFMKGPAKVFYRDEKVDTSYEARILAADEDTMPPDPVQHYDYFAVHLYHGDDYFAPWPPSWQVVTGNIVVEY